MPERLTMSSNDSRWGMTSHPTVWGLAMVVILAIAILAVLRHLFGSIRVEAGSQ